MSLSSCIKHTKIGQQSEHGGKHLHGEGRSLHWQNLISIWNPKCRNISLLLLTSSESDTEQAIPQGILFEKAKPEQRNNRTEESKSYTPMTHPSVEPRQCPVRTEMHMQNHTCYFYYMTVKYLEKNTPELAVKCNPAWCECWRILSLPPVWPSCSGGTSASRWMSIWFSWDRQIKKKQLKVQIQCNGCLPHSRQVSPRATSLVRWPLSGSLQQRVYSGREEQRLHHPRSPCLPATHPRTSSDIGTETCIGQAPVQVNVNQENGMHEGGRDAPQDVVDIVKHWIFCLSSCIREKTYGQKTFWVKDGQSNLYKYYTYFQKLTECYVVV